MSKKITTPVSIVKLTNVAVVRFRRKGKRFEVACYRNKVKSWRSGLEKDIDEVVQIMKVFRNVSRGIGASQKELLQVFNTVDEELAVRIILEKGQLQVSAQERKLDISNTKKDICNVVAEKCVNTETGGLFDVSVVENAMKEAHFSVSVSKSAKVQALELIKIFQEKNLLPIMRANMRVSLVASSKFAKPVKKALGEMEAKLESEEFRGGSWEGMYLISPGAFRPMEKVVADLTKGRGTMDVVDQRVVDEGERKLSSQ